MKISKKIIRKITFNHLKRANTHAKDMYKISLTFHKLDISCVCSTVSGGPTAPDPTCVMDRPEMKPGTWQAGEVVGIMNGNSDC